MANILNSWYRPQEKFWGDYKPNQLKEQHCLHWSSTFQVSQMCFWPSSRSILWEVWFLTAMISYSTFCVFFSIRPMQLWCSKQVCWIYCNLIKQKRWFLSCLLRRRKRHCGPKNDIIWHFLYLFYLNRGFAIFVFDMSQTTTKLSKTCPTMAIAVFSSPE